MLTSIGRSIVAINSGSPIQNETTDTKRNASPYNLNQREGWGRGRIRGIVSTYHGSI